MTTQRSDIKRFESTRYTWYRDDSEMSSNGVLANNFRNVDAIKTQYEQDIAPPRHVH
jgi:hypothetical protein